MTPPEWTWWANRERLHRFVCDLLAGELARIAPGRPVRAFPWSADLRVEADLGADSLDRLKLATALAEAIHLHRSGIDDALLRRTTVGEWVDVVDASLDVFSAELTFRTSGSTGQPKWCVHTLANLEEEVDTLAELASGTRRVITLVPAHHIYGFLFTVLLPARLGVDVRDMRDHSPARLAEFIAADDLVVAHPDYWAAFVRTVPRVRPGAIGVTSTAPCPASTVVGVRASGIDRFIEIYGSSETAGIGWRDDPAAPFALFPFWRAGNSPAELTRVATDGTKRHVTVPDRLDWIDSRRVRPVSRSEGAVQVGGINVFPDRVRAVLCGHPGVAHAAVRLMSAAEGDRLKAFVVPHPGVDHGTLDAELLQLIAQQLTVPERPKSIVFGPALPTSALGKLADWPIAGKSAPPPPEN